jgi:bla regulator protein blaR1
MNIWIQSMSWTLIYSLGQGFVVYISLWFALKLMPTISANIKYHLSLSALTILFVWFATTWWQQFHALLSVHEQTLVAQAGNTNTIQQQLQTIRIIEHYDSYSSIMSSVNLFLPWLSVFYVIGLLFMLLRLSSGMMQLFSLRKNGIAEPDSVFNELLGLLKNRLHFEGHVQLFISAKAQVPMVIGFLKPMIIMPCAVITQLSMAQLETIVLHELAHIKRYDYLVNILQTIIETILFFNPFVWMISVIIRREREHCCDDIVLGQTPEPLLYATALATLANHPNHISRLSVAASGQSDYLFNRIKRIMEMKNNSFSYSKTVAAILIMTIIICSVVWLTPSFAHAKKDRPVEKTTALSKPVQKGVFIANNQEETQLVKQLIDGHLVDEAKGFVVEKKQNRLYINGQLQTVEIANKYLQTIKGQAIRVEVYPLQERIRRHPEAGFLQIMIPIQSSSSCVDYQPKKPGC